MKVSRLYKIKVWVAVLYIFALSTMFYIYESIAQYKANGAYIMVAATTIMLNVVNRSINCPLCQGHFELV